MRDVEGHMLIPGVETMDGEIGGGEIISEIVEWSDGWMVVEV